MLPFFTVCIIFSLVGAYALAPAISERPLPLMIDAAFLLVLAAVGFAALLFGRGLLRTYGELRVASVST